MTDWIDVTKQLPDADILVLAYTEDYEFIMASYSADHGWMDVDDIYLGHRKFTHWCDPIPPYEFCTSSEITQRNKRAVCLRSKTAQSEAWKLWRKATKIWISFTWKMLFGN